MGQITKMQLLPTIIILALLAFFVVLTTTLSIWYWRRLRILQKRGFPKASTIGSPPRRLTLRAGKAIPHEIAGESASARARYSLDLQSPGLEKDFEYDVEKGFTKAIPSRTSKPVSRNSLRSLLTDRGPWTPGKPPWLVKTEDSGLAHADSEPKMKRPPRLRHKDRSHSIPRPSLINIERRGSGQTQRSSDPSTRKAPRKSTGKRSSSRPKITHDMQQKRKGIDITESLFNAYKGATPWTGEIHLLPPTSVVMPGPAKTVASSTRSSSHRWSVPATMSVHSSIPTTVSYMESTRAVMDPDPVQPPAPLFSKPASQSSRPSLKLAHESSRKSFLTITDSPTSSTSSEHAVLGHKEPVPVMADLPRTMSSTEALPALLPAYNERSRPAKALSTPVLNPPEMLEKVRAFGRRHHDRPTSTALRKRRTAALATSSDRPASLAQRRQVSSELLRQIERGRDSWERDDGTSDLVQQLEETANMVQRQSRAASRLMQREKLAHLSRRSPGPTSQPREPPVSPGLTVSPVTSVPPVASIPPVSPVSPLTPTTSMPPMPDIPPVPPLPSSISAPPAPRTRSGILQRRSIPTSASRRPPSIEIDIPHFERGSLSFFDSTPTPPRSGGNDLRRGPSVMSNRSGFTIASSEISSNWTIGKAELVNIYPSVADEEEEELESNRNSLKETAPRRSPNPNPRKTPPYAKVLRSKYGQYPRGMRDKALPSLPMSPLRQSFTDL